MKNEFELAFNEMLEEKQLPKEVILETIEAAMVSAYRRAVNASNAQHIEANIDPVTGAVSVFAEKEVVDVVQDERTEVELGVARQVDEDANIGDMVVVESTPSDFGRVAAQTARQVMQQRIREAERESQLDHYSKQVGEIVSGVIQALTPHGVTLGLDMKAEGILPRNQQIPGERFRVHDRIQALLLEVKHTPRGPQIILSRSHRNFLRRLLENEVPEIYHGLVEIRSIAREPGHRSKVAVAALQAAVDPVGACVGIRGVRIQAIVRELNDEKIDVIEWDPDSAAYIHKALSPARVTGVYLNEYVKGTKTATVVVPEDQLSLAIGRDGQNARLAAKLTSWRIDIKSLPEATADALYKLQNDPELKFLTDSEEGIMPQIESILTKKAEGRPVTPEEYQVLGQFVDRVERALIEYQASSMREKEERRSIALEKVPETAFEMSLEDIGLTDRVNTLLSDAEYETIGDLMLQLEIDSDKVLALHGIGPKAMEEISVQLDSITFPEPEVIEPEVLEETEEVPEADVVDVPAEELVDEAIVASEDTITEEISDVIEVSGELELESSVDIVDGVDTQVVKEVDDIKDVGDVGVSGTEEALEEGEEVSFEEMFKLREDNVEFSRAEGEEDDLYGSTKKKSKKKKKFVEMEYDPDHDVMIVKRKHKRDEDDWEDEWDY
jgi:N utilization substance protein A